jgi:hypothetical protein
MIKIIPNLLFQCPSIHYTRDCLLQLKYYHVIYWVRVMVFNATANNISVILWQLVFMVEESGVPRENH